MYAMSSHLAILAIGLAIGSGATYLVLTLSDLKIRPQRGRASGILEVQCPPLEVVRLSDHRPNQTTLFEPSILRDRGKPMTPCWAASEVPDSPAELFLRSADTQPAAE